MKPLNPYLHEQLELAFSHVRISNDGETLCVHYYPDYLFFGGRLKTRIESWGETYNVSCPFCSDTRGRLAINHHWAVRDVRTRDDNLHLATCFNERCLSTREKQKELHALVFPDGIYSGAVEVPAKPAKAEPTVSTEPMKLPQSTLLSKLEADNPAVEYVVARGFCAQRLSRDYGVRFCGGDWLAQPRLTESRLIVPIYSVRLLGGTAKDTHLVGWQARILRACPDGTAKYLTSAGLKKSHLLYGLPQALKTKGPVVIVEGVVDVWAVGLNAVAVLGKTISAEQCRLVVRYFADRPVVIWLDSDAEDDAQKMRDTVRAAKTAAGANTRVVIAQAPANRDDPGECDASEVKAAIAKAMERKSQLK